MELTDKVVFVTGASSGIGLATARALVEAGARVVFAARSLEKLEHEAAQAKKLGGEACAVQLDVTSNESAERAVAQALDHFGRIDILLNDAGNGGPVQLWSASDANATRHMFEVHVLGCERMMRAVMSAMRAQGGGIIVNFASAVAWVPMPGAAAYSSAKAAVIALSQALRAELARDGIDVRVFSPPHTNTDAGKAWPMPLPKIFEPTWVANEVVRALRGRRACVTPAGKAPLLLQRLSPQLAEWVMNAIGWETLARASLTVGSAEPLQQLVADSLVGRYARHDRDLRAVFALQGDRVLRPG